MSMLGELVQRARSLAVSNKVALESAISKAVDELAERAPGPIDESELQVLAKLESAIDTFLRNAPSGKKLEVISLSTEVNGVKSSLTLCAKHLDPIGRYLPGVICKSANAESFLVD